MCRAPFPNSYPPLNPGRTILTTPIDAATAHQLLNILAEREPRGSTIVTSQFTPDEWYKSIPDAVIAESILNRLVAGAEIITLDGTNMRLA
nr:ATP-binding protein [Corynebacterium auris]